MTQSHDVSVSEAVIHDAGFFDSGLNDAEAAVIARVPTQLFIGGQWRDGETAATLPVHDPSTGQVLTRVADASPSDAMAALDAAAAAQPEWAKTPPRVRAEILRRAFDMLIARQDDLAMLMTLEMGKPLAEAKGEIVYAAEFFRWFSEETCRIGGEYRVSPAGNTRILTMQQPVGPCLFITPWNFPMAMGTRKIGPAIAAGCTMVVKPAAETPLSMLALAEILAECGLPAGVLNVVTTSTSGAVMEPLIRDGRARKLSFTGSTGVGRRLVEQTADKLLRVSMELGGNAPFLVFDDADLDAAVEGAFQAKMRNIGEACTAANRFIVHESVAPEFGRRLADRLADLSIGRGTADGVQVGPVITSKARNDILELIDDAVAAGASVLTGGKAVDGPGYFVEPTVLIDVPTTARVCHEEIFGPVAPISTFSTEQEALEMANNTEFGLIAYAFTQDFARAMRVAEALDTGMVGLNAGVISNPAAPFGGVKASGFGREGGFEGIREYLETKFVGFPV